MPVNTDSFSLSSFRLSFSLLLALGFNGVLFLRTGIL
jgi:hypothetical protein